MEKNKKSIIIGVIAVIAIVLVAVGAFFITKPSYERNLKKFGEALESGESRDFKKYAKKYMNLRAIYAMNECDGDMDKFEEEYKKAKKKDYENNEDIDKTIESLFESFEGGDIKVKISDVKKAKDTTEDDGYIGKLLADIKGMKTVVFNMEIEIDGEKDDTDCYAFFYKGKLVTFMPFGI